MEPFPSSIPLKSANPFDYAEPPRPIDFTPRAMEFTPTTNAAISPYANTPHPSIQPPKPAVNFGGNYTDPYADRVRKYYEDVAQKTLNDEKLREAAVRASGKPYEPLGGYVPTNKQPAWKSPDPTKYATYQAEKQAARSAASNAANIAPKVATNVAGKLGARAAAGVALKVAGKLASRFIPFLGWALLAKDAYDLLSQPQANPEGLGSQAYSVPALFTGGQVDGGTYVFTGEYVIGNYVEQFSSPFITGKCGLRIRYLVGTADRWECQITTNGIDTPNRVTTLPSNTIPVPSNPFRNLAFTPQDGYPLAQDIDPPPDQYPYNQETDTRPPTFGVASPFTSPADEPNTQSLASPKIDPSPQKSPLSPPLPNINPNAELQPQALAKPVGLQTPSSASKVQERQRLLTETLAKQQEETKQRDNQKEDEKDRTRKKDPCCDFATIAVKVFKSCGSDGKTPDSDTLSVTCLKSEESRIAQQFEQFYQIRAAQCDKCEANLVLPEYWQTRTGQRPQLVILYREIMPDGEFGAGYYPLHLAHYNKPEGYKPAIPSYAKGNIMGIYTFADNSKLIVNAKSITEAKRVIRSLLQWTDPQQAGELKLGEHGGKRYQEIRVKAVRIDFYPNGQRNSSPQWSKKLV
jgi:hypothetical protein